jgi:hypothetical protein
VFTYSSEQAFSLMKFNKLDLRVEMADKHLAAVLHTATLTFALNIQELSAALSVALIYEYWQ